MASKKKKRRIRSPHPGVVLRPPRGEHATWRASFEDPDTGRKVYVRLDPVALTTAELRRDWAIDKSKSLARRRMELESGATRATGTDIEDAIERYFKAHPNLRDKTLAGYRSASNKLLAWAKRTKLTSADDLTRARLLDLRAELVKTKKSNTVRESKGVALKASNKSRSAHTVNRELRSLRTILGYVHDLDLFPKLTHDDLRRALKRVPTDSERVEYLRPAECQKLLDAALRHDAEVFGQTREEHSGERKPGTTPRYDPIAPFVAFVLLTGCRLGEALALTWRQVDLNALDHEGRKVGEIHLQGASTKTHKARTIALEVSPALRSMLSALKLRTAGKSKASVFGYTQAGVDAAAKRLRGDYPETKATGESKPRKNLVQYAYGAPDSFTWQALRRTCGTFLTNAPGIFGAASAYRSAKQLGHSVQVAERHYVDVLRGIPRDARTLEAAMGIETQMAEILARVSGAPESLPRLALVSTIA